ncbi:hypothetical protein H0H87_005641 [Tephrocybe sp. NHM501043]|nr:hypothetical protein H0H87_005641 [Tephrocybe sp. NHM501043]
MSTSQRLFKYLDHNRNQAALIAFTIPAKWKQGVGLSIVATHVDSPNLKVGQVETTRNRLEAYMPIRFAQSQNERTRGICRLESKHTVVVSGTPGSIVIFPWLGVWSSKNKEAVSSRSFFSVTLNKSVRAVDRNINDSFQFNQETEFVPILGLLESQLNAKKEDANARTSDVPPVASSIQANHHSELLSLLASELSIAAEEIHDFELSLYDVQPASLGGLNNEFIFSPRMDNLVSSFCAVEAIAETASAQEFPTLEGNVNCIALFNHEEIGSVSTSGAESSLIPSLLNRLSPTPAALAQSVSQSFLISADMGHAVHPNYTSKHEDNHKPKMNGGIVIKTNAKQRYATDAISTFVVKQLVERKGGQVQEFEVRNDMSCGSTVGPMLSKIGLRTVDVGNAMLSMHSIRETAGSHDVQNAIDLFSSFFEGFAELDKGLTVD